MRVKEIEKGVTRSYPNNKMPVESRRLPENQAEYVNDVLARITHNITVLSPVERTIYTTTWMLIARVSAPIVTRNLNYKADVLQAALDHLIAQNLVWYDPELRAVLQCPPFSALHTPHEVKTFGWERAYTTSIVNAPLALLIYGPNTWMSVHTVCPRSGEELHFRVLLDDRGVLRIDAPADADTWRIWIPAEIETMMALGPHSRPINAFHTQADLDIDRQYHPDTPGVSYTLEQAMYFSECLLNAYQVALTPHLRSV